MCAAEGFPARNAHGVVHKRNLLQPVVAPIPDLRSGLDESTTVATAFQGKPYQSRSLRVFLFGFCLPSTSHSWSYSMGNMSIVVLPAGRGFYFV